MIGSCTAHMDMLRLRTSSRIIGQPWLRRAVPAPPVARHSMAVLQRLTSTTTGRAAATKQSPATASAVVEGVGAAKLPPPTKFVFPERLCVYHAGTGRVTFLACLKVSTLFIFTFFAFVVTPLYLEREGFSVTVLRTTASAVIPLAFVAWATSPFVTFIHLRLPPYARQSEDMLRRFITAQLGSAAAKSPTRGISGRSAVAGGLTGETELEITTMSYIAKPRLSVVRLEELKPVRKRLGIVNYSRDTTAENARRKWYMFPAVASFSIQETSNTMPKVPWVWSKIAERIQSVST
ncbi:uncharacterized protein B0I36DRAFT_335833 [Microdochium trichocladiopsis]|uniref:Uncharacterized protein n=1 Tax=Microdochium trichocladiopsis TaxID=1682393 RepID=A0A9P8XWN5_9PEZI|nr:uncharacterized protein B0I36DRAFT_335833 [Microdochium trichocladiopsis]KAH7018364.1 hypothetical protein B0I36DRAFT_335833 [Microdochium trichocladiopsis]